VAILTVPQVIKSITYKHIKSKFRVFRQSQQIAQAAQSIDLENKLIPIVDGLDA
jgi:hypothetical protein